MTDTLIPLKHLAGINERTLPENTEPDHRFRYVDIGTVGHGELVAEPVELRFEDAPSRARRLIQAGDTIVSTVRTYLRAVWSAPAHADDLVVSTGFAVLTPRRLDPRYFSWWVRSDVFIEEVVARSVGVSYPAVNALELGELRIHVPAQAEQRAVAEFLDAETTRIDALITKKRRMIDLLDERSKAKIDAALELQVAWSAAGIPVPSRADWPVLRLGLVALVQTGLTLDGGREVGSEAPSLPYLRVANVQDGSIDLTELKEVRVPEGMAQRTRLRPGDVLMTEGGDPDKLGRGAVWEGRISPCLHQNHVFALRPSHLLRPDYLALVTRSTYARAYFEVTASKTTGIASTSTTKIAAFRLPVPSLDVQSQIVDRWRKVDERLTSVINRLNDQIDLLHEHRQALITAAVTGELEVPGVAA